MAGKLCKNLKLARNFAAGSRAAKALESYQEKTDDLVGEKLTLNMGPSHPATHGVLKTPF